jgi:hypothetical protein
MKVAELVEKYERLRAEATELRTLAPLAKAFGIFLEDLRTLDGTETVDRAVTTAEAGAILGLSAKTVRRYCEAGRFAGAWKTSGQKGEWRIPVVEVYTIRGTPVNGHPKTPRLWEPEHG